MSNVRSTPSETLSIAQSEAGWRWTARGAAGALKGEAVSPVSAWKTAAFAAGALEAFARVERRRF